MPRGSVCRAVRAETPQRPIDDVARSVGGMSKELGAVYWRVRLQRARETHAGARQALRLHPRVVMQRMEASSAALQARPSSSSPSPTFMHGGSVPPPARAFLNHISSASEIPTEGTRAGGTVRAKRRPGDRPASRSPPLRQRAVSAHPPISPANHALRPHTSHGMPLEIEGRGRKDGPSGWLPLKIQRPNLVALPLAVWCICSGGL